MVILPGLYSGVEIMTLKALTFAVLRCLILLFVVSGVAVIGQTTNAPTAAATNAPPPRPAVIDVPQPPQPDQPSVTTDPAKIAEFQSRFAQGQQLEEEGKLTEALAVYDGIIADAPDAKGSLRAAGLISMRLGDLARADGYFEKLHQLVPDYPMAIESLIQINQALKREVKVAILNREFHDLRAAGKVPNPYFVRERINLTQGDQLVMTEFFDYHGEPFTVWMGEVFDATGARKRWFLLNYEPDATKALRAKDARLAQAEVFNLYEYVLQGDQPREIDVDKNYIGLPDYQKTRIDMLAIIANPVKPLYSVAVPPK
jgi:tetratricopeptide (TPR) repeat protein